MKRTFTVTVNAPSHLSDRFMSELISAAIYNETSFEVTDIAPVVRVPGIQIGNYNTQTNIF
jgi:hypothetical protein